MSKISLDRNNELAMQIMVGDTIDNINNSNENICICFRWPNLGDNCGL